MDVEEVWCGVNSLLKASVPHCLPTSVGVLERLAGCCCGVVCVWVPAWPCRAADEEDGEASAGHWC